MKPTVTERYDLLGPGALADPYPLYRRLRREAPVVWDPRLSAWLVSRYEDVTTALADPCLVPTIAGTGIEAERLPVSDQASLATVREHMSRWLTFLDPSGHRRRRRLVLRAMTPELVRDLRPRIVEIAEPLLDAVRQQGRMDAVRDFAQPLPILVIAELFGFPDRYRERLKLWSHNILAYFQVGNADPSATLAAMRETLAEMEACVRELVARRRDEPREDLLTRLLATEMNEDEVVATAVQFLFAGHETTRNLLGNGLFALLRAPDQLELLRREPTIMGPAIEEILRSESPLQLTGRVALAPTEVRGERVAEGEMLLLLLGSANRDPEVFPDPERFDVRREGRNHVAFGVGGYFCPGAALTRLEAEVAFEGVLRRLPGLALGSEPATWRANFAFRGLESLPVRFDAMPEGRG